MMASDELARYAHWVKVQDGPWTPPASLEETALCSIEQLPVVWLNHAVDMMAFGSESPPNDPIEEAARRCQASRAICEAAKLDLIHMLGHPDRRGDASDPIPRAYFDVPRQLGNADNSLETALDKVSMEDFMVATDGGHQKWFNVRLETQPLFVWLRSVIAKSKKCLFGPSLRDDLISRAQQGEITPEIAEAEALASGLRAFASEPEASEFNPMNEARWTLSMTLAWIAWRDVALVRKHQDSYRAECRGWVFREWKQPVAEGTQFALRKGWFVETEPATNVTLLKLCDDEMRLHSRLPVTTKRTISDALDALKEFLTDGALIAEAIDVATGKDTDIPDRSWSFLTLQQERDHDVLKNTSLDGAVAFRNLKFRRRDLLRLWPSRQYPGLSDLGPITPEMFQAVSSSGDDGYVPFDATICWVSTNGGSLAVEVGDEVAWERAVNVLLPRIASGKIEVIGRPFGMGSSKKIDRLNFVGIKIINPLHETNDFADDLLSADPHIVCSFFGDDWAKAGGDKFYQQFVQKPEWTHLQVKKSDVLREITFQIREESPAIAIHRRVIPN